MDTAQWPQGIGVVKPVESSKPINGGSDQKKPRPDKDQPVNCPRCNSTNTKFCYYNNYSLSQPRYFCKTCRRYWTAGGSLRNVPVGGGSRKNKRSSSSSSSSSSAAAAASSNIISSKKILTDHNHLNPPIFSTQNPKIGHEGHDLNLAYNPYVANLPFGLNTKNFNPQNPIINTSSSSRDDHHHLPMMEFLKTGNIMSSFMSNIPVSADSNPVFSSSGFGVHDYKPSLGFSLDGIDQNGYNGSNIVQLGVEDHHHHHLHDHQQQHHHHQDHDHNANQSTILFPFEELKPVSTTDEFDHHQQEDNDRGGGGQANGYWNGMLAGGSW